LPTFKYNLELLIDSLPLKFNLFVDSYKIGSEHWTILLIWNRIKDRVIKIINKHYEINNTYPIVYIDDCIYSARNAIANLSRLITDYNENTYLDDLEYIEIRGISSSVNKTLKNIIIIACPYISQSGANYLTKFKNDINIELNMIASNITIPVISLIIPRLVDTEYENMTLNEMVTYMIDIFNNKDAGVAIYFDHKIANNFASFPDLYGKIAKNIPSRYKIEELERMLTLY